MNKQLQQLTLVALGPLFGANPWVLLSDEGGAAGIVTNVILTDPDNRERLRMILLVLLEAVDDPNSLIITGIPTDLPGNPENN